MRRTVVLVGAALVASGCAATVSGEPVVAAGAGATTTRGGAATTTAGSTRTSSGGSGKRCAYRADGEVTQNPAHRLSGKPEAVAEDKPVTVVVDTSSGAIPVKLDVAKTPCTVRSFVFLATQDYFTNTTCHRLTAYEQLKVLQCGDPSGTGTGGPGYVVPDEFPVGLKAAGGGSVIYPRGTVALANAGPGTGGSQFFVVYGDSAIPPTYSVFGETDATGLSTVDQVAGRGVSPSSSDPGDGQPATTVTIVRATVRE